MVVTVGIDSKGAAKEGGRIGRGDADDVERLSILMRGDCTPAFERVIGLDGADSVKEGGGMFSWFDEGCIVGDGVPGLVNSGVEGDAVKLLLIVVDARGELWSWWIEVVGRSEHGGLSSS